jgi:hypothetical protein
MQVDETRLTGRIQGPLFTECASWVWEQLQEEGYHFAGELVELILFTERELALHTEPLPLIAARLAEEFRMRGVAGNPNPLEPPLIQAVLEWEDEFLGLAGIPRRES